MIEMMVAIGIFTMGIGGFSLLFSKTWKINQYTLEMGQASMAAAEGNSKMCNYIRSARQGDNGSFPLVSGSDNELVLYSDYDKDGVTERLHFYKSGQSILMGIRRPTATMPVTYPSGNENVITIVNNVVNNSSMPVFSYYNRDYPDDMTNNPLPTPVNVSNVRLIKIYLWINIVPNREPDNIQMQTFVALRNLSDYDRIR